MEQRVGGSQDGKGGEGRGNVVWPPRKGVGFAIGTLAMGDDVVVGREGCRPPGMAARSSPSYGKIFQVLVVSEYINREDGTFDIHPPLFKRLNHC